MLPIITVRSTVHVVAHNNAYSGAADGADVVAVCDDVLVVSNNAADSVVVAASANLAGVVAVFDGAVVAAGDAADVTVAGDADAVGVDAAGNHTTAGVVADNAANIIVAVDAAIVGTV